MQIKQTLQQPVMRRSIVVLLAMVSVWLFQPHGLIHALTTGTTTRVSVSNSGAQSDGYDGSPLISADGRYVVFRSNAANLVSGDTNGEYDIFVRDLQTGINERVSVSSAGVQGNGSSEDPSISADGHYVAFASSATNLVSGDTNGYQDIFVHDRQTGITERVSVSSSGEQAYGRSPSISDDGRYVAFQSSASNLVSGDTNDAADIFVHDRQTGVTERVSVSSSGEQASGRSPSISADGRYVAFQSSASNLVIGDTNGYDDVFVHDRQTGTTERVSVNSSGEQATGYSSISPMISGNGRYVVFASGKNNLVIGDTNGNGDIFVHDRQTGTTERVSVSVTGAQVYGDSYVPSISADGRYVAFESFAWTLVIGDTNNLPDVFLADRQTGWIERVSVATGGGQADGSSSTTLWAPSVSADGRYVVFRSIATNLVEGDIYLLPDIFLRDRGPDPNPAFDSVGVFRPTNGWIYLKFEPGDGWANVFHVYGIANDLPIAGDWNGDGVDTIGVYRNGSFYLRNDPTNCEVNCYSNVIIPFGTPGDWPVAGDWDADGIDEVGVFRDGTFYLVKSDTDASDLYDPFGLGIPGDLPIAGDWDADGDDTVGVFRPSNGWVYLKMENTTGFADQFQVYGIADDWPLAGDWDGDGVDSIGVFRDGVFFLRNDPSACTENCFADVVFGLGNPGDLPIAGDWDGHP